MRIYVLWRSRIFTLFDSTVGDFRLGCYTDHTMNEHKQYREVPPQISMSEQFVAANEHRDYAIYTRAMDAALEAKAKWIFPYLGDLPEGAAIVDVGSGTGKLAELAARTFHGTRVFALDYSHELLELATNDRTFLHPVYGNAADQHFPENALDAAYVSTSGHEMESFGGKGTADRVVGQLLKQLKPGGRLVWRDFAKPSMTDPVYMRICSNLGNDAPPKETAPKDINYNELSSEAIFECFYRQFDGGGAFSYERVMIDGVEYFKLSSEWAHEYYLRKDYTGNFLQEVKEKYTYWTPEDAVQVFEEAGFTNVRVVPEHNEWILANRLHGKIALHQMNEAGQLEEVDFPPTHMVVVGEKPQGEVSESSFVSPEVDYHAFVESIVYREEQGQVEIGEEVFAVKGTPLVGAKKICFWLQGDVPLVLKTVRPDAHNLHTAFRSLFQSVERQGVLEEYGVPYLPFVKMDPEGPPYRYIVQQAAPEGAIVADQLVREGRLTERDIAQIAEVVNKCESGRLWQVDTNPYSWIRVEREDGTTEMVYISGKVYQYDEEWAFGRIGLWQWVDPQFVADAEVTTSIIPTQTQRQKLVQNWGRGEGKEELWKNYLHPRVLDSLRK